MTLRQPHLLILNSTGFLINNLTIDPTTLQDHIAALPSTDQWASIITEISDDSIDLAHGIRLGTATAISDGSYHDNYGTSCSILRGPNRNHRIITVNIIPGPPDSQSAYRSELAGISGSLLIIQALCNQYKITQGSITLGLDGQSAINTVSGSQPLKPHQPDFDLLCNIQTKLNHSPLQSTGNGSKATKTTTHPSTNYHPLPKTTSLLITLQKHISNISSTNRYRTQIPVSPTKPGPSI